MHTARALFRLLEWRNHEVTWPHITVPVTELLNVIVKRINEASVRFELSTNADLWKPFKKLGHGVFWNSKNGNYHQIILKNITKHKIRTDCNCGFWKPFSLTFVQSSFLLLVGFDIMPWETHLFEKQLWFCHLLAVSSLKFCSIAKKKRVIGNINTKTYVDSNDTVFHFNDDLQKHYKYYLLFLKRPLRSFVTFAFTGYLSNVWCPWRDNGLP